MKKKILSGNTFTISASSGGGGASGPTGYIQLSDGSGGFTYHTDDNYGAFLKTQDSFVIRTIDYGTPVTGFEFGANNTTGAFQFVDYSSNFGVIGGEFLSYYRADDELYLNTSYVYSGRFSGTTYTANSTIDANTGTINFSATNGIIFNNDITAPNVINSFNGLTGAVGIAAGSNITITPSGNTFTISASSGGVAGFTLTTLDFSSLINKIEFDVYTETSGFPLAGFATKSSVESLVGFTATIQDLAETTVLVGTVESTNWYRVNPMPSGVGDYLTVTMKPTFYGITNGITYTAEQILSLNISTISGALPITGINNLLGYDPINITGGIELIHKEESYITKTITGQSWVTNDSFINCRVNGLTTADHDAEDAILEGIRFEINNIVPGTGFDIIGYAPEGTYGKYKIKIIGQ